MVKVMLIVYLFVSVVIASNRISKYVDYENWYNESFSEEDGDIFDPPTLFDWITKVFLPAELVMYLWIMIRNATGHR